MAIRTVNLRVFLEIGLPKIFLINKKAEKHAYEKTKKEIAITEVQKIVLTHFGQKRKVDFGKQNCRLRFYKRLDSGELATMAG